MWGLRVRLKRAAFSCSPLHINLVGTRSRARKEKKKRDLTSRNGREQIQVEIDIGRPTRGFAIRVYLWVRRQRMDLASGKFSFYARNNESSVAESEGKIF